MFLLFFIIFIIGVIALIKGGLPKLKIPNRKVAVVVTIIAFVLAGVTVPDNNDEETKVAEADDESDDEGIEVSQDEDSGAEKLTISFDESIDISDEKVVIEGETNLHDGVILSYEITNEGDVDDYIEGEMEVNGGKFSTEEDVSDFSNGEIRVYLAFLPYMQPNRIMEIYGEMGENIEGDKVIESADANIIEAANIYVKAKPIELEGSGDTATDTFSLTPGLAFFSAEHTGGSNFVLEFMDENGNQLNLLVNEIGSYNGTTAATIPDSGEYLLNVTADGSWNIDITQSIPSDVPSAPTTLEGNGDDVVFVNLDSGLTHLEFSHLGESNFIVMVNDQNLLVNEIGNYEGSQAQQVQDPGTYAISVKADGNWSIQIE